MRVQFPLEVPKMLLSTNGRSLDFQSKNTGSIPVRSTKYPYRLTAGHVDFQSENTGSIPVRSAKYPYRLTAGHVDFQSIDTSSNLVGDAR